MQITATVRLARAGAHAEMHTRTFSALPGGLEELAAWLLRQRVSAAVMEATGIYWEAPHDALERAGIEVLPVIVARMDGEADRHRIARSKSHFPLAAPGGGEDFSRPQAELL